MQPVSIYVDENKPRLGRIQSTTIGGNGLVLTISGRDYISDMVECHVDPALKIKQNTTLGQTIIDAAKPVGITEVTSDGGQALRDLRTGSSIKGGPAPKDMTKAKGDEYKPRPGEGIYQFCNRLAARHGVTIQPTDSRSKVNLSAPAYEQAVAYKLLRSMDPSVSSSSCLLSATVTRNYSKVPTFTLGVGKKGKGGLGKSSLSYEQKVDTSLFSTSGLTHDGRIHPVKGGGPKAENSLYRFFFTRDEQARNKEQLERAVKRTQAERTRDVLQYQATVRGHKDPVTGRTWAVDTIVHVRDELCDVDEKLWIEGVTFEYTEGQGATTQLVCWLPGSFKL
jgi:prophage tail gpP-like protein